MLFEHIHWHIYLSKNYPIFIWSNISFIYADIYKVTYPERKDRFFSSSLKNTLLWDTFNEFWSLEKFNFPVQTLRLTSYNKQNDYTWTSGIIYNSTPDSTFWYYSEIASSYSTPAVFFTGSIKLLKLVEIIAGIPVKVTNDEHLSSESQRSFILFSLTSSSNLSSHESTKSETACPFDILQGRKTNRYIFFTLIIH